MRGMRVPPTLAFTFVLLVACSVSGAHAQVAGDSPQRLYLDPGTGSVTANPTPQSGALELTAREVEMLSSSSQGLNAQRTGEGPTTVHLRGRFRQMSVATIGPDGQLRHGCVGPEIGHIDAGGGPVSSARPSRGHTHDTGNGKSR